MAAAVAAANAFMRTIGLRNTETTERTAASLANDESASSSNNPLQVLPGGVVLEHHEEDPNDPFNQRRRCSSANTTNSTTNNHEGARTIQQQLQQPQESPSEIESNPLSVSTAIIGLLAASNRTFHDVQDINFAPRTLTASLQRLLNALKSFKLTVQLLYKWLRRFETGALPLPDRAALVEVDALIVILTEAVAAVSEAGTLLVDVVHEATTGGEVPRRISDVVPEYAAAFVDVSERIDRVDHLIGKLLTIFQISSINEAMAARAAIDTVLPHIMGDNAPLAESIRSMHDIFGARALIPPSRLAHILARPPPGYSIPADNVVPLPDYTSAAADGHGVHPDGSVTIRPLGWSLFATLTIADVGILSLVPLPFTSAELRYGQAYYTSAFSRRVDPQLAELVEMPAKGKAIRLAQVLGLRTEAVALTDDENFARRVGLEMENATTRSGEPRPRLQPSIIIGGQT